MDSGNINAKVNDVGLELQAVPIRIGEDVEGSNLVTKQTKQPTTIHKRPEKCNLLTTEDDQAHGLNGTEDAFPQHHNSEIVDSEGHRQDQSSPTFSEMDPEVHTLSGMQETFLLMEHRKSVRNLGGIYHNASKWRSLWMVVFVSLFLATGALSFKNSDTYSFELQFSTSKLQSLQYVAFVMVTVLTLYTVYKAMLLLRLILFVLLASVVVLLILTGRSLASISLFGTNCPVDAIDDDLFCRETSRPCRRISGNDYVCVFDDTYQIRVAVMSCLFAVEALTLIFWIMAHRVYPMLVRRRLLGARWWFRLRAAGDKHNTFYFRCWNLLQWYHSCRYKGSVDSKGRPHGWGQWTDDSFHGEHLQGFWDSGVPVGPFKSREYGSGYAFASVRLGVAQCRREAWNKWGFIPGTGPLLCGVCSVESSISGAFFKKFPKVTMLIPPTAPCDLPVSIPVHGETPSSRLQDPSWMAYLLQNILHYNQNQVVTSVVVALNEHQDFVVSGHYRNLRGLCPTELRIQRRRCLFLNEDVSPPGSPLARAHSHGLRDSVASLPTFHQWARQRRRYGLHIEGWQSSNVALHEVLLYFPGFNQSLECTCERLGQFLALGDFPAHVKPIIFSYPAGHILTYFQARRIGAESTATAQAVRELLQSLGQAGVRQLHVMAHSMGARAWLSAFHICLDLLGGPGSKDPKNLQLTTCTLLNPDYEHETFITKDFETLRSLCSHVTLYGDTRDEALWYAEIFNSKRGPGQWLPRPQPSLGRSIYHLKHSRGALSPPQRRRRLQPNHVDCEWLDMDVVDTSWMETNVHNTRHSYFNINNQLIEELRDIITFQLRAAERPRLALQEGNVYCLSAAPNCIVNP